MRLKIFKLAVNILAILAFIYYMFIIESAPIKAILLLITVFFLKDIIDIFLKLPTIRIENENIIYKNLFGEKILPIRSLSISQSSSRSEAQYFLKYNRRYFKIPAQNISQEDSQKLANILRYSDKNLLNVQK